MIQKRKRTLEKEKLLEEEIVDFSTKTERSIKAF